jgi:hypothetical protein
MELPVEALAGASGGCNGDGTGYWYDNSNPNFAICIDAAENYESVDFSTGLLQAIYAAMAKHVAKRPNGGLKWIGSVAGVIGSVIAALFPNAALAQRVVAAVVGLVALAGGAIAFYYLAKKWTDKFRRKGKHAAGLHFHVQLDCFDFNGITECPETKIDWENPISNPGPWGN